MDNPKLFGALLNGVMKREYEGDATITPEFLKEAIFPSDASVTIAAISRACDGARDVMARAAYEDYDVSQMDAFLKLRKSSDLSAGQKEAFSRFWRAQRSRIHEVVRQRATWENSLERMAWRIDVQTRSRSAVGKELSEPVAIVEFHILLSPTTATTATASGTATVEQRREVARFELDRDQVKDVLAQVVLIEKEIASVTSASEKPSSSTPQKQAQPKP